MISYDSKIDTVEPSCHNINEKVMTSFIAGCICGTLRKIFRL